MTGAPVLVTAEELGYAGYKHELPDGETNIWAPFVLNLDWELAWWVKL